MAEMTKQEWLQRLQEELKTFQKIIFEGCDRLQGIIRETRKELKEVPLQNQKRPEDIPIQRLTATEMAARREKGLCYCCDEVYKFGHQCTKRKIFMFIEDEESDEETEEFMKEIKPPDSTIVTGLSQLQEVPVEASIDAKETKSWPKQTFSQNPYTPPIKPPNQNLPTLRYPNQNTPPIQTQIFHTINQNTAAHLVANRPNPWPNKLSINTNPNRPNPWPNKLPRLTYFIRPKPWPDEPPMYKHKPRTGSNETRTFGKQTKRRRSYQFQLLVKSKSDDHLQTSLMAAKVRILDFPVTTHALKEVHYQFRSTLSRAATIDSLDSGELKETRGDPGLIMADEAALVALMPIQLEGMKIVGGDRLRSRPGRLPTLFLGVVRPRARPERQLLDSPEANHILNRFQNRVLIVAQLRSLVIAILRHLPEFDPGDFCSKEDKGRISFEFNGYLGHFGRIFEENRRRIEEEVTGLVKKKLWVVEERFGVVKEEEEFGCRLPEEEEVKDLDLKVWEILVKQRSQEEKGNMVCKRLTWNPILNAEFSTLGEPGQTLKWTDWAVLQLSNHSALGYLGQQHIWATIAIGLPFQIWAINRFGPLLQLVFHFFFLV